MATTRLTEKISAIVSSQFPEFIQKDHQTFVEFVELYYKFLEQDQNPQETIQNLQSYGDIDKTTDSFVQYFLKNYTTLISDTALADKKILIKRIKDLYESKGTKLSFEILFRLFYNEEVDVIVPYEFVLIPSDGTFDQRHSLRIKSTTGERANLVNRSIRYIESGIEYVTPVVGTVELTTDTTEVFLDKSLLAPTYEIGRSVSVTDASEGGNVIFEGEINPTTLGFSISQGGTGFKLGQVYTINFGGGVGTVVRVSNVSATGGVTDLKFLNFGHGYPNQIFSVVLDPTKTVSESGDTIDDNTEGFIETGEVNVGNALLQTYVTPKYPSAARYFEDGNISYLSSQVVSFSTVTSVPASGTTGVANGLAAITFTVGALAKYPGEFTTNRGFLSEPDFRLQNDLLYQPFAYQLVTGTDINTFKDVVLQLVHPAGQRLFNNRNIEDVIDYRASVEIVSNSNINLELHDLIDILDADIGKQANLLVDNSVVMTQNITALFGVPLLPVDVMNEAIDSGNILSNVSYCEIDYFDFGPAEPRGNASANHYLIDITEGPDFT